MYRQNAADVSTVRAASGDGAVTGLLLILLSLCCTIVSPDGSTDVRFISYEDLLLDSTTQLFEDGRLFDYSQVVIDQQTQQIYLGLRNYLVRLRLDTLELLEMHRWAPDDYTFTICLSKGQNETDCHNFVRVLIVNHEKSAVLTCGTNAFSPLCAWRKLNSVGDVVTWVSIRSPANPHVNCTTLLTSQGELYSGTITDISGRDAAIYRQLGLRNRLRTPQYNSRWLNEPDFVSSYEIGDYVYFFFREAAVEYINCGKNDAGGKVLLQDNWTSFVKARLNCSLPGEYPFYFNELQSTYFDEAQQLIYAVFTTAPTGIYGSAVCVYNVTALNNALNGAFKHQANSQSAWARVPNTSPAKCGSVGEHSSATFQRHLVEAQKYQMSDNAVQPIYEQPAVVAEKERYTHIVVDKVTVLQHSSPAVVNVAFLATLEGAIHKYSMQTTSDNDRFQSCLVEMVQVTPEDLRRPVRSLQLHQQTNSIIIGTDSRLYRLPTQRCGRLLSKTQCLSLQDPYCGWDPVTHMCTSKGHPHFATQCASLSYPVDGDWSEWSQWHSCSSDGSTHDRCVCRSRSCDSPKPRLGGNECVGPSIQVANCSVDGQWSSWSSWSLCAITQQQLDKVSRTRQRQCNSPPPRHGGRTCTGDSEQMEPCAEDVVSANTGGDSWNDHWSTWAQWTPCSAKCGGGQQTRQRVCLTASNDENSLKHSCIGDDLQMRICNIEKCPFVRRIGQWSSWQTLPPRDNQSSVDVTQQRTRCVCRARLSNPALLRSPAFSTQARQCNSQTMDCGDATESGWAGPREVLAVTSTTAPATTVCPKCDSKRHSNAAVNKQNSIIDKELLADGSYSPSTRTKNSGGGVRVATSSGRLSLLGFCHCRDLGPLRVCRRCAYASQNSEYGILPPDSSVDAPRQSDAEGQYDNV